MIIKTKNISSKSAIRIPLSAELKKINPVLKRKENEVFLYAIDGLNEMFVNYVDTAEDAQERYRFVDTLVMFVGKYPFLTKTENLNVIKIILLNELYKKNQNKQSIMKLVREENRFSDQNAAAFKFVIKKELCDLCMDEYGIFDRESLRYITIVKSFLKDFEDFYYSFR